MEKAALWSILIGTLLLAVVAAGSVLRRLPLTTAILYLSYGVLLGPVGIGLLQPEKITELPFLERFAEIAVVISLFSAGLKLRLPFRDPSWKVALRLATISMLVSVGLLTLAGHYLLGFSLGGAVLLAAILAPTDPVLASDVQVEKPGDRDELRFSLTAEAGLNDGTAFPMVMLGLGLLGLHELGSFGARWFSIDVLWAIAAGLGIGYLLGLLIGHFVLYLRREHREAVGLDDFLALGLMALSYGVALELKAYGFLAVFASGLALRRIESRETGERPVASDELKGSVEEVATHREKATSFMTHAVLSFNEQLERIGEVVVVVILGAYLSPKFFSIQAFFVGVLLFFLIRPISVWVGLWGVDTLRPMQRRLAAWFGIRGLGSVYYLTYAINHGVEKELATELFAIVLNLILASVVLHGVSVTPLMNFYENALEKRRRRQAAVQS